MLKIIIGICAMEKKSKSQPMTEILRRLEEFDHLETIVFPEKMILNDPIEKWPTCDCLISFHSRGFPLDKAKEYATLRKTMLINDLASQHILQDRRKVYEILRKEDIDIPNYFVGGNDELQEFEDHITFGDVDLKKPFVEKPISAEDHNVYIYFPSSAGGGCQRLFRKIGNKSSVYCSESAIRRGGKFIYEEFLPTDGTDVKVYTVGPDYAHAEARKSPGLDGNVCRDAAGKEVRFPIILSPSEKLISRKICQAFRQTVCGFDLLRANGKSYVCDVNGFSFVKNSKRYYHDASRVLAGMILRHFDLPMELPRVTLPCDPLHHPPSSHIMELCCVVAVVRHGDRTPKQKMKIKVNQPVFFKLFEHYGGRPYKEVKLKTPKQLQHLLDLVHEILKGEMKSDEREKFEQIKFVLEMNGSFSGINRKVQLKAHNVDYIDLVLKWGGELTTTGRKEAEELGRRFRYLYPDGVSDCTEQKGMGLLRLHATFRHDLKIYASDEGRVQMTAAAFAKGLLALEGELAPILVQMVKSANTEGLLNENRATRIQSAVKERMKNLLQYEDLTEENKLLLNPCNSKSISSALERIRKPLEWCRRMGELMDSLLLLIEQMKNHTNALYHGETWEFLHRRWRKLLRDFRCSNGTFDTSKVPDIYDSIKYDLLHNFKSLPFAGAEELYEKARVLADAIIPQEYGLTVSEKLLIAGNICGPLLKKIRGDFQRNVDEVVHHLDERYSDTVMTPSRHVRTRLYFTSESHLHSLLTVLRFGGLRSNERWNAPLEYLSQVPELNYLSQIVIMLYEDPHKDVTSPSRFRVELHFSPGNKRPIDGENYSRLSTSPCSFTYETDSKSGKSRTDDEVGREINVHPLETLNADLTLAEMDHFLECITTEKTDDSSYCLS